MRLLVDESCDAIISRTLRTAGFDVSAVSESQPGASDTEVISLAINESRTLVTEDKDFGQLVYASGHGHHGVILLRYPFALASNIAHELARLIQDRGLSLQKSFVVLQPGKIRIFNPME